jgi:uncharacterized repeat protein (TIGR01451 family)
MHSEGFRRFARGLCLTLALALLPLSSPSASAVVAPPQNLDKTAAAVGNRDVRVNGRTAIVKVLSANRIDLGRGAARASAQASAIRHALARFQAAAPGSQVRLSPLLGGPEVVRSSHGPLSGPAAGAGVDIVRAFLHAHKDLYGLSDADVDGLTFLGESVSKRSGLRMVRLTQSVGGIPIFQSESRFRLDRQGGVVRTVAQLVPDAAASALAVSPALTAQQAFAAAMDSVGIHVDPAKVALAPAPAATAESAPSRILAGDPRIAGPVGSQLVYFPLGPGVLVPAWMQVTFTKGPGDWTTVVDGASGLVLWRKNLRSHASTQEARFSVYTQADGKTPSHDPAPHDPTDVAPGSGTQFPEIARTTVDMSAVEDTTATPDGWIPDGGNTTTGNNTDTYLDTDADNTPDAGLLDANGRPVGNLDGSGNMRDFLGTGYAYTPAPMGGNPDAGTDPTDTQFRRGSVTQLFYDTNWYHDQLYELGFNEAAGNFQTNNNGKGGVGGDPVLAEAQDGSGTDNSNFATPPDGTSGRMQMFVFDFPKPQRDGSLDATIVLHELTHGLSNRLIGDANGLIWDVGSGMGEGWSDFYALSLLNRSNADDPDAEYPVGAYATYKFLGLTDNYLYGIRRFPYSTDHAVNPLTWADVDDVTLNVAGGIAVSPLNVFLSAGGGLEVHNVGEVWANTLWGVRSRIIKDPAGANGDVPTGNTTMLQLVTDGLKMTPINPGFADARDAILDADCATNACANEASIWAGFADRGLGYKAVAPLGQDGILGAGAFLGVGESFAVPYLDFDTVAIDDSLGNNNGAIDPGEPIKLTVSLFNPWRNAAKGVAGATAALTSTTAGVTILAGASTYGAIAAQASVAGTAFVVTIPKNAACGQSLHFTVAVTSSLGTQNVDFTLRVGAAGGAGAPVTYSRTIAGGLAIPDADLRGVTDSMTIPDDLEIQDIDFEVNDLPHTFTGDLVIGLKMPNGYGTSLIYHRGMFIVDNDGDNFTGTLIDSSSKNDLNLSGSADAPYTGDWLPAFNSPIWGLFGIPNLFPDPVDQLGYMDGQSSQGVWKIHLADEVEADTGRLNTWSVIVTPTAFTCSAFAGNVAVTGTKTVAGTFAEGGAITYTVTLTNNGSLAQANNPGNEFTDFISSGLTLVSASATSGTAVANTGTNTVTWDGVIPPLGGSVTITIHATVKAGLQGSTISNQGAIAFDADANGTNESSGGTDDPSTAAANDPTVFRVAGRAIVSGTKAATGGPYMEGSAVTYIVVLTNSGALGQTDNPGDEFSDVLPAGLTLTGATATSGTATLDLPSRTVHWNGAIAAGASVTITIHASVNAGTTGQTLLNQGNVFFDADGDGTNESSAKTDDPATPAAGDATRIEVVAAVPTLSSLGLAALALLLLACGAVTLKRRERRKAV